MTSGSGSGMAASWLRCHTFMVHATLVCTTQKKEMCRGSCISKYFLLFLFPILTTELSSPIKYYAIQPYSTLFWKQEIKNAAHTYAS